MTGSRREFDVCVIGTGAGGGVMLQQLTEARFDVVALQRGPALSTAQFGDDELDIIIRDRLFAADQLETYRHDAGQEAEPGRYNQLAHAVGGSMTRWSGWSWRFREDDFRVLSAEGPVAGASLADWPIGYEEMEPWYSLAERDFGVAGRRGANPFAPPQKSEYPNPLHPERRSSLVFERGAEKLGHHPFPLPVAINPRAYRGRAACTYGGTCQGFGCPIHAKASSLSVCLPRARATRRLDLRPYARVFELPLGPTEKCGERATWIRTEPSARFGLGMSWSLAVRSAHRICCCSRNRDRFPRVSPTRAGSSAETSCFTTTLRSGSSWTSPPSA